MTAQPVSWPGVFAALAAVDLGFIGTNVFARLSGWPMPPWLHIGQDHGLPETWGYLKWATTATLLAAMYVRHRRPCHGALAAVFLIILADDSLMLHETLGARLAEGRGLPDAFGLRARDLGELVVFGAMGLVALVLLGLAARRSRPGELRMIATYLGMIALLAGCGVVFDMLHVWARPPTGSAETSLLAAALGAIEDGGEMVMGSLILAVTVAQSPERAAPGAAALTRPAR